MASPLPEWIGNVNSSPNDDWKAAEVAFMLPKHPQISFHKDHLKWLSTLLQRYWTIKQINEIVSNAHMKRRLFIICRWYRSGSFPFVYLTPREAACTYTCEEQSLM